MFWGSLSVSLLDLLLLLSYYVQNFWLLKMCGKSADTKIIIRFDIIVYRIHG